MDVNLTLGPELEQFVKELVTSGEYPSADEAIRDGLRLLKDRESLRQEKLEAIRSDLAVADEQFKRGQYTAYTSDSLGGLSAAIKSDGRKVLAAEKKTRHEARTSPV